MVKTIHVYCVCRHMGDPALPCYSGPAAKALKAASAAAEEAEDHLSAMRLQLRAAVVAQEEGPTAEQCSRGLRSLAQVRIKTFK